MKKFFGFQRIIGVLDWMWDGLKFPPLPVQPSPLFPKEIPVPKQALFCLIVFSGTWNHEFFPSLSLAPLHALQGFVGFAVIPSLGFDSRTMGKAGMGQGWG